MDPAARARLDRWTDSLRASAESLLDLAEDRIDIAGDPIGLTEQLATGTRIAVASGPTLDRLRRVSRDARADGEHVLWVALGRLTWVDGEAHTHVSPLILWPVTLDGSYVRSAADRKPRLNDALIARMRADHELALDGATGSQTSEATQSGPWLVRGSEDVAWVLETAAALASGRDGWATARVASLAAVSFADFDIWRDVVSRGHELSQPLAWLLGAESPPAVAGGADSPKTLRTAMPLDADASQSAAICAAAQGSSIVVQGAPGTGKSQTVANIAAHCTSQGMSVLVVSERKTALDSICRRLADAGLNDVCAVAGESPPPPARSRSFAGRATSAAQLAEVATVLDDHVRALHSRTEFGMSIHEVVARLVELRTTPNAALAEPDAAFLDRATFVGRRAAVVELAQAALAVQPVMSHPWRESELCTGDAEIVGSALRGRAAQALETAAETTAALADAIADVSLLVPGLFTRAASEIRALGELAQVAALSPRPGAELFSASRGRTDEIGEQIALIRVRGGGEIDVSLDPASFTFLAARRRELVAEITEQLSLDDAEFLDAPELWAQLKKWSTSVAPLRFVALRRARAQLRAVALPNQLTSDEAMIQVLEAMIAERACREALERAVEPAQRWFGELWSHVLTLDLEEIEAAIAWAADLRRRFDSVAVTEGEMGRQTAWRALIAQVVAPTTAEPVDLEADRGAGANELRDGMFSRLADAYSRWVPAMDELAAATGIKPELLGVGPDHVRALRAQIDILAQAIDQLVEWTCYDRARRRAIDADVLPSVLALEKGDLDASELALAWERATLVRWLAPAIASSPTLAQFDGLRHNATLARFADLDRGAMAVAPGRLSRLAPCVLATPQAVARCALPAFDLVIIDDASRLSVPRSLGALARGHAVVVVGDAHEPRPIDGSESTLDLALSAQLSVVELSTHYRSQHHDLFAFANQHFHGGRVAGTPAAHTVPNLGVQWMVVEGAATDGDTDPDEARAMVGDIAAKYIQGRRSVAVVVFSTAQRDLVEELLEAASIPTDGEGRVWVGTPDYLRGHEYDLVYVSLGHGVASMAGSSALDVERWLNVATTRAREQLVVVGRVEHAQGDLAEGSSAAARYFSELAAFAQSRLAPIVVDETPVDAITEAIGRALAERGWTVRHRVGAGISTVELAVLDPEDPQRCVLAVESDGVRYAASASVCDRDRLRDQQLVRLGWRVHRIWSLDWWNHPERELQRAHAAIVTAVAACRQRGPVAAAASSARRLGHGSGPVAVAVSDTEAVVAMGSGPTVANEASGSIAAVRLPRGAISIGPYAAAAIPCGRRLPDDMFAGKHSGELAKVVEQVLAAEAPIHLDLLSRRAAAYFGVGRVTPRITEQVRSVLDGRGRFGDEPDIVWRFDQDPSAVPAVRVVGGSAVASRDIGEVPLAEVAAAARIVVERAGGIAQSDLVRDCARLLGFARITDRVKGRVALGVQLAAQRQLISIDAGRAHWIG